MKVAIVGHRAIARADADAIAYQVLHCLGDQEVEELLIPAIDGVAANALCFALQLRREQVPPGTTPKITAVFPGRQGERPPWAKCVPCPEDWAPLADQVIELEYSMDYAHWDKSLDRCNEYVVDQMTECGQVLIFWNGHHLATDITRLVRRVRTNGIPWQHITIVGEEE